MHPLIRNLYKLIGRNITHKNNSKHIGGADITTLPATRELILEDASKVKRKKTAIASETPPNKGY
jgi:hypothetical protein